MVHKTLIGRKKLFHGFFNNSRNMFISGSFSLTGRNFNLKNFIYRHINFGNTENKHVIRYSKNLSRVYQGRKYTKSSYYLSNYLNFLSTLNLTNQKIRLLRYVSYPENYNINRPYLFINKYITSNRGSNNMSIVISNLTRSGLSRRNIIKHKKTRRKYKLLYNIDRNKYRKSYFYRNPLGLVYSNLKSLKTLGTYNLSNYSSLSGLNTYTSFLRNHKNTVLLPIYTNSSFQLKKNFNSVFYMYGHVESSSNINSIFDFMCSNMFYKSHNKFFNRRLRVKAVRNNKPFIFMNTGFSVLQKVNNTLQGLNFKGRFKKSMYSFLYPNQYKRSIFMSKKKIIISRFIYKRKFRSVRQFNFSFKLLKKKFHDFFIKKKYNMSGLNNYFNRFGENDMYMYSRTQQNIIYRKESHSKGLDNSDKLNEVFIPRVRFKPGYQRLWRVARGSLKELLGLNYTYQQGLTRYLTKFRRFNGNHFLNFSEMSVDKVVMYSKLLPDIKTLNMFMAKCMIYVNGSMSDSARIMYVNDIVQVIVSKWYYIFYRWLSNWTVLRVRKFKRLVYRKGLASRHRLMKTRKVKSRYIPKWVNWSKFDSSDIKNNLEVDYFTLSSIVIYEPYILDHHHFMELYENRSNIYRMYNWKYIT